MNILQPGTPVSIKNSTLSGTVRQAKMDDAGTKIQYLVDYVDHDGVEQHRYFETGEITVTEEAPQS